MTLPPVANRLRLLLLWGQRRRRRAGVAHAGVSRRPATESRQLLGVSTSSPTCNSQRVGPECARASITSRPPRRGRRGATRLRRAERPSDAVEPAEGSSHRVDARAGGAVFFKNTWTEFSMRSSKIIQLYATL
jgi:hypothetical protein